MMSVKKSQFRLLGFATMLIIARIGEYGVDYLFGDKDGHFSSPLLVNSITLLYIGLLLAMLMMFTTRVHALFSANVFHLHDTSNAAKRFALMLLTFVVSVLPAALLFWAARYLLAFSEAWQRIFIWLLLIISGVFFLLIATPPLRRKQMIYRLLLLLFSIGMLYVVAVAIDALLYRYGSRLSFLSQRVRDYYYSVGVFAPATHPLYREAFKGYVVSPQATAGMPGDVYATYNLPLHSLKLAWPIPDAIGWPNQHPLREADVLFIGDSFGRANGAGFANSIPVRFEERTHLKAYVAGNEGYGLAHYVGILRYLTKELPKPEDRFHGKNVYILLYLGNDLGLDLTNFWARRSQDAQFSELAYHAQLTSLVRLFSLARTMSEKQIATPQQSYSLVTEGDIATIEKERRRTDGWYPHFFTIPVYQGQPFAFERGNFLDFEELDWLEERRDEIQGMLQEIQANAAEIGATVRVIVLPTRLRILAPYFKTLPADQSFEFDRLYPKLINSEDSLRTFMLQQLQALGIEALDMTPFFNEQLFRTPLFWAGDLHYTPEGYQQIAAHAAMAFHATNETQIENTTP